MTVSLFLKAPSQQKSSGFVVCGNVSVASLTNSVDPDLTALAGAVRSRYTLFASMFNPYKHSVLFYVT